MHRIPVVRAVVLALVAAGACTAAPAAAQGRCTAPEERGWHSCLTTVSHALDDATVRLTRARPKLVVRDDRCPARRLRRTVVVRAGGRRLARAAVPTRCRRGVARWSVDLRLDVDLPAGTVVRSSWGGIPDSGDAAPAVKLKAD